MPNRKNRIQGYGHRWQKAQTSGLNAKQAFAMQVSILWVSVSIDIAYDYWDNYAYNFERI